VRRHVHRVRARRLARTMMARERVELRGRGGVPRGLRGGLARRVSPTASARGTRQRRTCAPDRRLFDGVDPANRIITELESSSWTWGAASRLRERRTVLVRELRPPLGWRRAHHRCSSSARWTAANEEGTDPPGLMRSLLC
jgi:hypothetical protein